MNPLLANDQKSLSEILHHTLGVAERHFEKSETIAPGRSIDDIHLEDLPLQGIGSAAALDLWEKKFGDKVAQSAGPRYFGFVTGGSTPAAIAGDWLVSAYDQNACGSNDSIAPQIERQTIHFLKELFGLEETYFGSFVTGATMSNFVGLALGRQWIGELAGVDFSNDGLSDKAPVRVVSATPHSSIMKAMSMLGIGRKSFLKVETLPDREAADLSSLEMVLKRT